MADRPMDLRRYAEAAAVMREVAPAAPSPHDERACRTAAEACDRMADLAAAREALCLGAQALEAIGTPPTRPYPSGAPDDDARYQQWQHDLGRYCQELGRLRASLAGCAGERLPGDPDGYRPHPASALRVFRRWVQALELA
jgi:hypothetical protein